MTDDITAMVRVIAEEIEEMTMGDVVADDVTADSLLWSARPEVRTLGLDSLQFIELVYRVEQRAGVGFPDLDPSMVSSVGTLADRLLTHVRTN